MGKNTQNYTENDTINKKAKIIYTHNIDNFNVLNSTAKINHSKLARISILTFFIVSLLLF